MGIAAEYKIRGTILASIAIFFSINVHSAELELDATQTLALSSAKRIADACEVFAIKNGIEVSIAIVNESGHLILFRRMRGSYLASVELAVAKAETAIRFPVPTRTIAEYAHGKDSSPGKVPGLAYVENIVTLPGGLPIKAGDQLVGGIGVSGATGDQDEACAQAGLDIGSSGAPQ